MSNIVGYTNNHNWSRLDFPVAIKKINEFEKNNDIAVNVLGIKGQRIYISRNSKHYNRKNVVNLLLIDNGRKDIIQLLRVQLGCLQVVIVSISVNSISA